MAAASHTIAAVERAAANATWPEHVGAVCCCRNRSSLAAVASHAIAAAQSVAFAATRALSM